MKRVRRPPGSRRAVSFVGVRAIARVETKHKATEPASVTVGAVAPRAAQAVADAGRLGPPKAYLSQIFRSRNRTDPFRVSRKMATPRDTSQSCLLQKFVEQALARILFRMRDADMSRQCWMGIYMMAALNSTQ